MKTEKRRFTKVWLSSLLAEAVVSPVCTLKTEYQLTSSKKRIIPFFTSLMKQKGVGHFYASFPVSGVSQSISTSGKYYLYSHLNSTSLFSSNVFVNGIVGCIPITLVTHPFDVIRIAIQTRVRSPLPGENEKIPGREKTLFSSGWEWKKYYRGYSKTLCKTTISASLFFPLNDILKERVNYFLASLLTSIIATLVLHPIDFLKTLQIGREVEYSFSPLFYYRGYTLTLLRNVPHFVVMMTMMELL